MGKVSEHTLTIVCCHTDDTFFGYGRTVVTGLTARTGHQSATIEIDQYGQTVGFGFCRYPDVEVEAIFAAA